MIFNAFNTLCVLRNTPALNFFNLLNNIDLDSIRIMNPTR